MATLAEFLESRAMHSTTPAKSKSWLNTAATGAMFVVGGPFLGSLSAAGVVAGAAWRRVEPPADEIRAAAQRIANLDTYTSTGGPFFMAKEVISGFHEAIRLASGLIARQDQRVRSAESSLAPQVATSIRASLLRYEEELAAARHRLEEMERVWRKKAGAVKPLEKHGARLRSLADESRRAADEAMKASKRGIRSLNRSGIDPGIVGLTEDRFRAEQSSLARAHARRAEQLKVLIGETETAITTCKSSPSDFPSKEFIRRQKAAIRAS